jgi:hypothetical protein
MTDLKTSTHFSVIDKEEEKNCHDMAIFKQHAIYFVLIPMEASI